MVSERNLVFVSFYAGPKSAAKTSCEAILTQLKPFKRRHKQFDVWDRSQIPAGSDKDIELQAALQRCRVAVVLVSPEYLASDEWEAEAKPLLAAAQAGEIRLLWQQVSPCNCDHEATSSFAQVIQDTVLTSCTRALRERHEQRISEEVFKAWSEFTPLSSPMSAVVLDEKDDAAGLKVPSPIACDAVALVIIPSGFDEGALGGDKGARRSYQWLAFIQKTGEDRFREIPNAEIAAGLTYEKERLPELLQSLQCWIDTELEDVPVLEVFASDDLLHEDWGGFSMQVGDSTRTLHDYQPFLLRSSDRLLNPRWSKRRGALKRMHLHLREGTGAWLPLDQVGRAETLEKLDGQTQHPQACQGVVSALYSQQPKVFRNRPAWFRSALMSRAPLVIWPSNRAALADDEMQHCFRDLALLREDGGLTHELGKPHCPDLAGLARARQQLDHPKIDLRGLTILVDHPDRAPDRTTLRHRFSAVYEDSSSPLETTPPRPASELFISP